MQEILTDLPLFEEMDLCFRMAGWQEGIHRQLTEMQGPPCLREPRQRASGETSPEMLLSCAVWPQRGCWMRNGTQSLMLQPQARKAIVFIPENMLAPPWASECPAADLKAVVLRQSRTAWKDVPTESRAPPPGRLI